MKQWIVDHQPEKLSFWKQLRTNLQDFPNQTLVQMSSRDDMKPGVLPAVGSTIRTEFKDWINDDTWEEGFPHGCDNVEFKVAGYNLTIPKRVKYVNENGYVAYVPTRPLPYETSDGDRLGDMTAASFAFSDMNGDKAVFYRSGVGGQSFTYGNNIQFNAPTTYENLNVSEEDSYRGTFSFAGYTMTLVACTPIGIYYEDYGIGSLYNLNKSTT